MKINLSTVPKKTGCYLWKDQNNQVIYVGKAKNLRTRMQQYFYDDVNPKTKLLVKHITGFEYILVENESSALITELNLINKYEPKYNIRLKQTQSYPYLKLSMHPLGLEITKKYQRNDKNKIYFGPFPEGFSPGKIKKLLESIYPVGKCLNPKGGKPCLNFQLGVCPGYCVKEKTMINEAEIFRVVTNFLKGDVTDVLKVVKTKIVLFSKKQMYEQAMHLNSLLPIIQKYREKQKSWFKDQKNRDIIGSYYQDGVLAITISYVRYGKLLTTNKELISIHDLNYQDTIIQYLQNYYLYNYIPDEIITDLDLTQLHFQNYTTKLINPKQGMKFHLLKLANEQAKLKYQSDHTIFELKIKQQENAHQNLQQLLKFNNLSYIEMVDISNTNGKHQVGVVVAFNNFIPDKKLYRKYSLNDGNNDYQHIYEVTYRHFRQKLLTKSLLPNLFIVDGKNQIWSARKALIELKIETIILMGLIKNKKHDTDAIITEDNKIVKISNYSNLYLLLGNLQDEVHRFALDYHRQKKGKEIIQ